MVDFKALREELTDESIKNILLQYNVEPVAEDDKHIIFPTCCHEHEPGETPSPKLWYYKDTKLFHCFTKCDDTFDIFTLLQKMHKIRGNPITVFEAASICGLDSTEAPQATPVDKENLEEIRFMQSMNNAIVVNPDKLTFKTYDKSVLRSFHFDYIGLSPWLEEGIGVEALQKFNIGYDKQRDAIIIPNFDIHGNLIGVRARFFKPEDIKKGKYRPLYWNHTLYNHPTGRTFYGIYENHKAIERKKMAVIFEGEKSVLKYGTIYGNDQNIALATLGQNITSDHIAFLRQMGVRTVILAYDTDYEDYKQQKEVEKKYREKASILSPYFNMSYLIDYDFLLPYKSSPIDGGKEIFETILSDRRPV